MILQTRFEMSRVFLFGAYTILKIGTLFDILDYFGLYIYNSRNVNYLDMGKLVFRCVWDAETAGSSPAI